MMSRPALQLVVATVTLAGMRSVPVHAQTPQTPAARADSSPRPANWPRPVEDNGVLTFVTSDQLEGRMDGSNRSFKWDIQGWIGTDHDKLWIKSEGLLTGEALDDGDQEILYDRPIPRMRYFDWQAGLRVDADSGPTRVWAALGVQGLAPYFFNVEPTLYVRDGGRFAGRIEGSYDLYLTQRLILQPQVELNFYSRSDPARGIGGGLSDLDSGARIGFQLSRKFAPYVGYTWSGAFGATATLSRQAGQHTSAHRVVFGVWTWH